MPGLPLAPTRDQCTSTAGVAAFRDECTKIIGEAFPTPFLPLPLDWSDNILLQLNHEILSSTPTRSEVVVEYYQNAPTVKERVLLSATSLFSTIPCDLHSDETAIEGNQADSA